ncbi:hypothetical protein Pcinc_014403 [Petrolisthes cinctipes]|uniref:BZIP domain-containing protein n=1 Tax=Petrolisthes cinctipes TaxID=88211 RepID=A0AAE1FV31_PETCI|nr:hypothetical protein Pcinc_014403 [Petrolisthes cinctipes]
MAKRPLTPDSENEDLMRFVDPNDVLLIHPSLPLVPGPPSSTPDPRCDPRLPTPGPSAASYPWCDPSPTPGPSTASYPWCDPHSSTIPDPSPTPGPSTASYPWCDPHRSTIPDPSPIPGPSTASYPWCDPHPSTIPDPSPTPSASCPWSVSSSSDVGSVGAAWGGIRELTTEHHHPRDTLGAGAVGVSLSGQVSGTPGSRGKKGSHRHTRMYQLEGEQKKKRTQELNNEASRLYRGKMRQDEEQQSQRVRQLTWENWKLQVKATLLKQHATYLRSIHQDYGSQLGLPPAPDPAPDPAPPEEEEEEEDQRHPQQDPFQ